MRLVLLAFFALSVGLSLVNADQPAKRSSKEALQAVQDLVGSWRCTCTPEGTKAEQFKNFWIETMSWEWKFKDKDVWLNVGFEKGKHFTGGELRYLPVKDQYELTLKNAAKDTLVFTGKLEEKVLTFERSDEAKKESQRLVFRLLHGNRITYRYDAKAAGKAIFTKVYDSGATKEGVAFASGDGRPECIVTGGTGTITVSFRGKTYYVCCTGCRDEFNADPAKYVKEFNEKKKK